MKTNYHTHTVFCDGKNTAEEMVLAAIEKRFSILGFSGHSMFPHAAEWHMAADKHDEYFSTIRALKEKYADRIMIYCGLEADFIPGIASDFDWQYAQFAPDYLIGSVHYLVGKNGFLTVDDKTKNVSEGLQRVFNGDGKKAVCEYFSLQREMLATQNFLILGHADVIRKRNGQLNFFDEREDWYKKELKATAEAAARTGIIAEINTGGIARGAIDDVYPSAEFLEYLYEAGVPVTISSDAHSAASLDAAFDKAREAALRAGYMESAYFEDGRIRFFPLLN